MTTSSSSMVNGVMTPARLVVISFVVPQTLKDPSSLLARSCMLRIVGKIMGLHPLACPAYLGQQIHINFFTPG